ncbi:Crp/Fnr family transcriptional regulator [Methylibium sp.]|uniref:Crp/Fnr family transcriptional regulator n=1 Tax=Methylibium sp. TaxID=2067992 RepID=UPI0025F37F5E|nr:Crp/Fnr family transcriptional regulator [Methylibium sp.]
MPLAAGDVLQAAGIDRENVYFPTQAVISLQYATKNGDALEVARIGYESVCGISLLMGGETASCRSIVQHPGYAFRIRATMLKREFDRGGVVCHILLRCAQSLLSQVAQTSLCSRHHRVEQQLSRWLLLSLDRVPGNEVGVTHEWIANALGVRRESVTQSLAELRETGCLETGRNRITVLDRAALEAQTCECYSAIKLEYARLAPNRHGVDNTLRTHGYAE